MKQPENRLTPEEIAFQKEGDSADVVEWNRQFGLLVAEYLEAVDCEDEGWIGDRVHEVRKALGYSEPAESQLIAVGKGLFCRFSDTSTAIGK